MPIIEFDRYMCTRCGSHEDVKREGDAEAKDRWKNVVVGRADDRVTLAGRENHLLCPACVRVMNQFLNMETIGDVRIT